LRRALDARQAAFRFLSLRGHVLSLSLPLAVAGFVGLVTGAEMVVRGGARLARALGVSPVVVGLTVVAIGTSAPEFVVCLGAAWRDSPDIATGNVVGSNLANIGIILGVAGLVRPLPVSLRLLKVEMPALMASTAAFAVMAYDGRIGGVDGGVLVALLCALTMYNVRAARREPPRVIAEFANEFGATRRAGRDLLLVVIGLLMLLGGGHLLVESAVEMARRLGVSELIIGLTLVAVGTSLPELATSVVAVLRNEPDIAVGNVVGSNLFNLLAVLGPVAIVSPIPMNAQLLRIQVPALLMLTGVMWPILRSGHTVNRWEAGGLLTAYAVTIGLSTAL
jgi:cation:H+ antiporter